MAPTASDSDSEENDGMDSGSDDDPTTTDSDLGGNRKMDSGSDDDSEIERGSEEGLPADIRELFEKRVDAFLSEFAALVALSPALSIGSQDPKDVAYEQPYLLILAGTPGVARPSQWR
jgi:hypothetical protein